MKNLFKRALILGAMAGLLVLAACDEAVEKVENLTVPQNITITVVDRLVTVSWDEVANAQGYEITTTSENCGSGYRLTNTKNNTAINNLVGTNYGADALKDDKSNGAVEIKSATSIQITLMPMGGDDTSKPMATYVTAMVKALGGTSGDIEYLDSAYSGITRQKAKD